MIKISDFLNGNNLNDKYLIFENLTEEITCQGSLDIVDPAYSVKIETVGRVLPFLLRKGGKSNIQNFLESSVFQF